MYVLNQLTFVTSCVLRHLKPFLPKTIKKMVEMMHQRTLVTSESFVSLVSPPRIVMCFFGPSPPRLHLTTYFLAQLWKEWGKKLEPLPTFTYE